MDLCYIDLLKFRNNTIKKKYEIRYIDYVKNCMLTQSYILDFEDWNLIYANNIMFFPIISFGDFNVQFNKIKNHFNFSSGKWNWIKISPIFIEIKKTILNLSQKDQYVLTIVYILYLLDYKKVFNIHTLIDNYMKINSVYFLVIDLKRLLKNFQIHHLISINPDNSLFYLSPS